MPIKPQPLLVCAFPHFGKTELVSSLNRPDVIELSHADIKAHLNNYDDENAIREYILSHKAKAIILPHTLSIRLSFLRAGLYYWTAYPSFTSKDRYFNAKKASLSPEDLKFIDLNWYVIRKRLAEDRGTRAGVVEISNGDFNLSQSSFFMDSVNEHLEDYTPV